MGIVRLFKISVLDVVSLALGGEPTAATRPSLVASSIQTPAQAAGAVAGGSGSATTQAITQAAQSSAGKLVSSFVNQADAPSCMDCGSIMIRNGACYKCPNCGSTSGCS